MLRSKYLPDKVWWEDEAMTLAMGERVGIPYRGEQMENYRLAVAREMIKQRIPVVPEYMARRRRFVLLKTE